MDYGGVWVLEIENGGGGSCLLWRGYNFWLSRCDDGMGGRGNSFGRVIDSSGGKFCFYVVIVCFFRIIRFKVDRGINNVVI